mgnify:CR=1 FL=1
MLAQASYFLSLLLPQFVKIVLPTFADNDGNQTIAVDDRVFTTKASILASSVRNHNDYWRLWEFVIWSHNG